MPARVVNPYENGYVYSTFTNDDFVGEFRLTTHVCK